MANPPHGFVSVPSALSSKGIVSVIGVVVDVLPQKKTSGTSAFITFTIKDRDLDNGHTWDGLKIRYFNDNENFLPQVKLKDVVLLRNIRVRQLDGKTVGVAAQYANIPWAVFRPELDPTSTLSTGPVPFDPSHSEKEYAKSLLDSVSSDTTVQGQFPRAQNSPVIQESASKPKHTGHRQFLLVKDVQEGMYVDLLCEIVKAYFNDSEKVILYATDYTANEDLIDYGQGDTPRTGDEYGYLPPPIKNCPGPLGRMTLQVTLWEPHACYARKNLKANDIVRLTNVRIKRSRADPKNLEASIHTDRHYKDKIHAKAVHDKADATVRELLRRKKQYTSEHGGDPNKEAGGSKKSKKQQQQQRKKEEKRMEEGQALLQTDTVPFKPTRPNKNIQAINPDIPIRSLEDIISNESHKNISPDNVEYTLPFQNLCYRAHVNTVDFFPPNLEDFSVPLNGDDATSSSDENNGDPSEPIRWEWRFCLLLESGSSPPPGQPKGRVKLFVSGHDAEYLLGAGAVDLRRNDHALAQLREKLFILWGDLEERKTKAAREGEPNSQPVESASSVPFVCCIKEYGVECSHNQDPDRMQTDELDCGHEGCLGWERRFAMFETTIHS